MCRLPQLLASFLGVVEMFRIGRGDCRYIRSVEVVVAGDGVSSPSCGPMERLMVRLKELGGVDCKRT